MAHEALVSLNLIIESFLNIAKMPHEDLLNAELIQQEVWSLKSILELEHFKETERLIALKGEILEAIPKFRDLLQDFINKTQLLFFSESRSSKERSFKSIMEERSKSILEDCERLNEELLPIFRDLFQYDINESISLDDESINFFIFSYDLETVKEEMISFLETMKKINKEYNAKLDLETSNKVSPLADEDLGGNAKDMVDLYDEDLHQLIHKLTHKYHSRDIISVVGMAGVD